MLRGTLLYRLLAMLTLTAVALVGCSDDDEDSVTAPAPGMVSVRVIHASYDAPAVDILVDDAVAINALGYGQSSGYAELTAGTRNVKVVPDGATTPIVIDADLPLTEGMDYTVLAVGQLDSVTAIFDDDVRTPVANQVKIRFIHAVPDAPAVDIKLNSGTGASLFTNQEFKDISNYQQVASGSYTFAVTASGDTNVVALYNPVTVTDGKVYTVVAHGTLDPNDAYPFAVRVFVDNDPGDQFVDLVEQTLFANVRVIHTSYDAPNVDILVDGATPAAIANLAYGASSGYAALESGSRNIQVVQTGTTTPAVIDSTLTLAPNTDYTVFALDQLGMIFPGITVDARTPDPTQAKLRFVHASPDAPAVDIKLNNGFGAAVFSNDAFGTITDYTSVGAGSYTFAVTGAGSTDEVIRFEPVSVTAGTVYTVVAHGTLDPNDAYPFAVRVFVDNDPGSAFVDLVETIPTASLRVIHTSYDAPNVDVAFDDAAPAISNLAYGQSSGYADVRFGTRNVKVTETGTMMPIFIEADLPLLEDSSYTVFAVDQATLIDAVFVPDFRAPNPSQAKIRFVHASPDAPAVDIKLNSGTGTTVFGNTDFKGVTDYTTVAGGDYTFVVTAAGDTNIVVAFEPVTVTANTVYTVVAHGTLDANDAYPFAVRVFVDNDPGDQFVDLVPAPPTAKVRFIHGSYDAPNVDVLVDDGSPAAISNLAYRATSGYAELEAGTRNFKVVQTGTTTPAVIDSNITLTANTDYTVVAIGELALIDAVLDADARVPDPAQAKVRFIHASPDAPAVDIKLNNGSGPAVFTNRAFGTISPYTTVAADAYTFSVTATGDTVEVIRFNPVSVNANTVYTVVAFGTLDINDTIPFTVRVFVDNGDGDQFVDLTQQVPTSNVRVIHTSYDAPNVDIIIDDDTPAAIQNLAYPTAAAYAAIPSGSRNIKVVQTGTVAPAVIDTTLVLAEDAEYTVLAIDELASILPLVVADNRTIDVANAKIRFIHASPDAPAVDIRLGTGAGPVVFGNQSFGDDATAYSPVAAGSYTFVVTQTGDTNPVVTFDPVAVTAGTLYTVVAHGTLDSNDAYPFSVRVFVDNGDGNAFVDLTAAK